jgi:sulfotransferase family protein
MTILRHRSEARSRRTVEGRRRRSMVGHRGLDAAREGPIYIGGASRSGKTLMRWILSSHSRIVVTRRTEMWTRFAGRFGDLADPENLQRCLDAMLRRRHIAQLAPDLPRLHRDFRGGPATYGRLFALVHEQYAERSRKPRWGDQTAQVWRSVDQILAEDPRACFLHLVRDPRDRFAFILERRARRPGAIGQETAAWLASVSAAVRNQGRYAGRYAVVRYEDLVSRPEGTMREVCAFLGEEFELAMLRMDGVRRYDAVRAASASGSALSTAFVGRYRSSVSRDDVAFIQSIARDRMLALDYPLDPIHLTPGERFRYAARWPANIARMRLPA